MALAVWQSTITNESGDIQASAQIEVRNEATGALAAIYEDRDGEDALDNPFAADENGFARFYAAGGSYRITATKGGFSRTFRHVAIGTLGELDDVPGSRIRYEQTPAEATAGVTPTDYSYAPGVVLRYGTNATPGTTDMTAIIQTALNSGLKRIYAPAGTYLLTEPLDIPDGVELYGDGHATIFTMSGSSTPNIIRLTNRTHVTIRNIRFTPQDTGTLRSAFYLAECTGVKVIDCWVTGQTSSSGVYMFDCDDCIVDRLYFDGGANLSGYAVFMGGCKGCRVTNSVAYRPNFGFVVVGADSLTFEGIYTSTRTNQEAFGNIISGCHVTSMGGHAFDVNSATGTVISACTAEDYAGVSTHAAFQIKHNSGDDARQNVFSGCTARNVPLGFFMQQGSNGVFTGCTAIGVDWGFALNSSNNSQFHACAVYDFKEYGIWINSDSIRNIINGVYMETATGTAVGIAIGPNAPGCNGNMFDNIRMRGTMAYAIDITTGNANNRFGHNVYVEDQAIRDIDYASIWPVVVTTPTISVDSTGSTIGARFNRGMIIAAARVVVTTAIVGSPQAAAGRVGDWDAIAAAQAITGDEGAVVNLTQASQFLAAGHIMLGRIVTAGSSGTVFFQYEGLPRL